MKEPKVTVDNLAVLTVNQTTTFGVFMEFGLERDILVPQKEMNYPMEVGEDYLVFVYEDKTGRLAASTQVGRYLDVAEEGQFNIGDTVTGTIYGEQTNGTLEVAIDNKYMAIILKNEYFTELKPGQEVTGTIKKILEDGRISFTPRKKMIDAKEDLSDIILAYLTKHDGFMPYNDKSTPEEIKKQFKTSKNYFKIALGHLMKHGVITQDSKGTHLKEKEATK
jgi:predicted RNA-binding protein (virulence factor B family)